METLIIGVEMPAIHNNCSYIIHVNVHKVVAAGKSEGKRPLGKLWYK
jgi:hypothetical protein